MDISPETLYFESEIARARIQPSQLDTEANAFAPEKQKYSRRRGKWGSRKPGVESWLQYFTLELLEEPWLMVRGSDRKLPGFCNVCRYRPGLQRRDRVSANGFAANTMAGLTGSPGYGSGLRRSKRWRDFVRRIFALQAVAPRNGSTLVFANFEQEARPLGESWGRELRKQREMFLFAGMRLFERRICDMKCNWKTDVDNYPEKHHLPSAHLGLNRELD